jgi:PTS system ascorbate-specific IIA component
MSVGLVLVTHDGVGRAIVEQASQILAQPLQDLVVYEVESNGEGTLRRPASSVNGQQALADILAAANHGEGVLIMTDLPGATPCNHATRAMGEGQRLVSGLNLPMLIRAWNYRETALGELVDLVIDGGRKAIMEPSAC